VLAHEIGHYKKKHIIKGMIISTLETWFILFVASIFLWNPIFSSALGASVPSFHICLIAFTLLFSPLNILSGVFGNYLSRKHEYEADAFAKLHYDWQYLISALKKLTIENLWDIKPHPIYEFVTYSHPSVLKRIWALQE
jgi:STE24 endopeptidase